jgi:uncharacterized cupin superfamily protein
MARNTSSIGITRRGVKFVVNLSGEVEITVSDGETRRFGPGTILLAEDVTGKGHISRGVGNAERVSIFVPLADR